MKRGPLSQETVDESDEEAGEQLPGAGHADSKPAILEKSESKRAKTDEVDSELPARNEEADGSAHWVVGRSRLKHQADGCQLSSGRNQRRVQVSKFKKSTLVSVREFYNAGDGGWKPTQKGISLTYGVRGGQTDLRIDQWNTLKALMGQIDEQIASVAKQ